MHLYKGNKVIITSSSLIIIIIRDDKTNLFMFIFRFQERIVISQLVEVTVGKAL